MSADLVGTLADVPPSVIFAAYSELSFAAGLASLLSVVALDSAAGVSFSFSFSFLREACPEGDLWSVA